MRSVLWEWSSIRSNVGGVSRKAPTSRPAATGIGLQEMARSMAFTFGSRPVQSFCASTPW